MPKGHFQAPKKPKAGQLARHLGACQLSGRAWGARINSWHAPLGSSFVLNWELLIYGIAKVYDKMEQPEMAEKYRKLAREVLRRVWDSKVEEEIRRYYRF